MQSNTPYSRRNSYTMTSHGKPISPVVIPQIFHICPPTDESAAQDANTLFPFPTSTTFDEAKAKMETFLRQNADKYVYVFDYRQSTDTIACWVCTTVERIAKRVQFTICLYMRGDTPCVYLNNIYRKLDQLWLETIDTIRTYVKYGADPVIRDADDIAEIYFPKNKW
jgi:hypothetical protein